MTQLQQRHRYTLVLAPNQQFPKTTIGTTPTNQKYGSLFVSLYGVRCVITCNIGYFLCSEIHHGLVIAGVVTNTPLSPLFLKSS